MWLPSGGGPVTDANIKEVPFQPWARAVLADRVVNELEPHTRCKPSGVTRPFLTPYGVEFVELQDLQRIYIFDIGGPHTYRTIYLDGRGHPKNRVADYYGHSIGWWESEIDEWLVTRPRGGVSRVPRPRDLKAAAKAAAVVA